MLTKPLWIFPERFFFALQKFEIQDTVQPRFGLYRFLYLCCFIRFFLGLLYYLGLSRPNHTCNRSNAPWWEHAVSYSRRCSRQRFRFWRFAAYKGRHPFLNVSTRLDWCFPALRSKVFVLPLPPSTERKTCWNNLDFSYRVPRLCYLWHIQSWVAVKLLYVVSDCSVHISERSCFFTIFHLK